MGFSFNNTNVNKIVKDENNVNLFYIDGVKVFDNSPETSIYTDWIISEDSNSIKLLKYVGTSKSIIIPATLDGKVITLNSNAFSLSDIESKSNLITVTMDSDLLVENNNMDEMFIGYTNLSEVHNIPNTVTSMNYTFKNCIGLTYVSNLPSNLINANETFYGCSNLKNAPSIPDSVENADDMFKLSGILEVPYIGLSLTVLNGTFSNCESIAQIKENDIPKTVSVLNSTFEGCSGLKYINIPDTVDTLINTFASSGIENIPSFGNVQIMSGSFSNCQNLVSIPKIPDSVISMDYAFENCYRLSNIMSLAGNNTVSMNYSYSNCINIMNISNIPNNVVEMNSTFYGCSNLKNISTIGSNVRNMPYAFSECDKLYKSLINIPDSVQNMYYTFTNCNNISNVSLSNYVYNLSHTFDGSSIVNVYINNPAEVECDASEMFCNTYNSKSFYVGTRNDTTFYNSILLDTDALYNTIVKPEGFNINDWKTVICNEYGYNLKRYTNNITNYSFIPPQYNGNSVVVNTFNCYSGLTNLRDVKIWSDDCIAGNTFYNTFYACSNLTNVYGIPDNITNMSYAFAHTNISNINLPNNVVYLTRTFSDSNINYIRIPNSVSIIDYTFYNCRNLVTIDFDDIEYNINSMTDTFTSSSIQYLSNIPVGVNNLYRTFYNCRYLNNIPNIPSTVTSLVHTFESCTNLTSIPPLPSSIGVMSYTFSNCTNITKCNYIPYSTSNLAYAFQGCTNLTGTIEVGSNNSTNIICTFMNTDKTKYVLCRKNLYNNAKYYWANKNGVILYNLDEFRPNMFNSYVYDNINNTITLSGYNSNTNYINIPGSYCGYNVIINGTNCFRDSNIETIRFMDGVKIDSGDGLFYNCKNLTTIYNLPTLNTLNNTFMYCTNLTELNNVTLPNVDTMYRTFCYCENLTNVPNIPETVTNMTDAFWHCHKLSSIPTLPNNVVDLSGAFASCYNLKYSPVIPSSVTNMRGTFQDSNELITAPTIPENVVNMYTTFYGCTNLYGNINIKSNIVNDCTDCFYNTPKYKNVYLYNNTTTANTFKSKYSGSSNLSIKYY